MSKTKSQLALSPEKLRRGMVDHVWNQVRDAVWRKFRIYNVPNCNPLYKTTTYSQNTLICAALWGYCSHPHRAIFNK